MELHSNPSVVAQLREARLPERSRKTSSESDDPSTPKRPKLMFLPQQPTKNLHNNGGIVTFSKAPIQPLHHQGIGLLQIAKPSPHQSGGSTTSIIPQTNNTDHNKPQIDLKGIVSSATFSIPGIPVPSMAGILTGLKSNPTQALFSLPGKRGDLTVEKVEERKTVIHVPGIPGPSSAQGSTLVKQTSSPPAVVGVRDEIKVEIEKEGKFLRPSSLPLTPGSFKTKKHVMLTAGDTLVSPETPRPRKSYMLQYQNGTAYTTLGLKCSTRVYYTTIFHQQPMYVENKQRISMYSNWRVVAKVLTNFFYNASFLMIVCVFLGFSSKWVEPQP